MYKNGRIQKLVTRDHDSPFYYAGMKEKCLTELLKEAGLNPCDKIDLTEWKKYK
ncbi:hypothetical protein JCM31447_14680 [Fluviispira sanaruensis]|uniref:Uncharacterized protein n=1 Tax=Fluviispira sanaruensis TaxID=2493639 RepID=A0A4P2VU92_FLUSA|nr:hypothetical protein JCM31447_14680 [Fluviispira sanaruensis]